VKIAVVVPTYQRPEALQCCLGALAGQSRMPDEVIVVTRLGDADSLRVATRAGRSVRQVEVTRPGVLAALEAGVAATTANVVAFTDDDAAPRPDWLERIEDCFVAAPDVGGVGGRDWCWWNGKLVNGTATDVGRMQWFGRMTSGHHLGVGPPRSVDVLKGVNMSFRRRVLMEVGFDRRLRGDGAQVHFEMALGLNAKRNGWRLVYDPDIAVDHYVARRVGEDQRGAPTGRAISDAVHNETLITLEHLSAIRRLAYAVWAVGVGTWSTPGIVAAVRLKARGSAAARPLWFAQRGRIQGWRSYRSFRRALPMSQTDVHAPPVGADEPPGAAPQQTRSATGTDAT
jgi:GT2 family glycosyltransferase